MVMILKLSDIGFSSCGSMQEKLRLAPEREPGSCREVQKATLMPPLTP
jgi:hypothetical protein